MIGIILAVSFLRAKIARRAVNRLPIWGPDG